MTSRIEVERQSAMKTYDFNDRWRFSKEDGTEHEVVLPHDAMIHEDRSPKAPTGSACGYFLPGRYRYTKSFDVPDQWRGKTVTVAFGGVYRNPVVSVNSVRMGEWRYGYTPFDVDITSELRFGQPNRIEVVADNLDQPNSRWYTGSGIYRPVRLLVSEPDGIARHGVRVTTMSTNPTVIRVETRTLGPGDVRVEVAPVTHADVYTTTTGPVAATGQGHHVFITVPDARLWEVDSPNLYRCTVSLVRDGRTIDTDSVVFGIRTLEWDAGRGFLINGHETLLRGGAIHHDNGVLGAATWDESEDRRARILKEAGFNAIRSAHNPTSDAFLDACDRRGLLVIDETFDMWYHPKSRHDYASDFDQWWRRDTTAMVMRDVNHPCVVMYSIGNEVSEPASVKGIGQTKQFVELIRGLDDSRPVTAGFNLMIIANAAKGKEMYRDGESPAASKVSARQDGKDRKNASLLFNIMASMIGAGMNNAANSSRADRAVSPAVDCLDIAGYNYASGRYVKDGRLHPDRLIYGSETFPGDICRNWRLVEQHPHLIGDFMWTAWDYLGEAGLGAWSYTGGFPFDRPYPWLLSGAGVIDILGDPDASSKYNQVVWGQLHRPVIAVRPVNHPGQRVTKSTWRATNAIESWSWQGCEGNAAVVEVFSDAHRIRLIVNGNTVAVKRVRDCKATFRTRYRPGTIEAVAYAADGTETGRTRLSSARSDLSISLQPESDAVIPGRILYVPVRIADSLGVTESNADRQLKVSVEGGEMLGFGSATPCTEERYDSGSFTTYQGRALAVVRAGHGDRVSISVHGEGLPDTLVEVPIIMPVE
ncbi:glycoside hydrolase family 2 protein [Bifidobacterium reuteri]|nr:glycoside hydrolase family 2 TIM barrel-domain containing protein [Bifidobacterium reuteri]